MKRTHLLSQVLLTTLLFNLNTDNIFPIVYGLYCAFIHVTYINSFARLYAQNSGLQNLFATHNTSS